MRSPIKSTEELVTYSQFRRRVPDGQKADLIDGVIYMASPENRESSLLGTFLSSLIGLFIDFRDLGGEVHGSRFVYRISRHRAPEPDVSYVAKDRLHLVRRNEMRGSPKVAVEIVSRDSRTRDYRDKKKQYERAKVAEYWIIDPMRSRAEFHRLVNGKFELVALEVGHIFRSEAIPGFWLDVNWLFTMPLPKRSDCLSQILAS